jgi:rSAM/selenodomain-associated transferase 1
MSNRTDTVVVLAKSPVAHRVKTRLTPAFSAREAAALAQAAIRDTLDVAASASPRLVVAWDGPHRRWLPPSATVIGQRGEGLDERLTHVFADVLGRSADRPTLLVGMDTPQLTAGHLDVDWSGVDAVLGPSEDGGYWAVGLRRFHPRAFRGVPMSTPSTAAAQLARLERLGLRVRMLPRLRDVDTPEDAATVAASAPDTRFARLHHRLVTGACSPATLLDAALSGSPVDVSEVGGPVRAALDVRRWQRMDAADRLLAARCEGPVLDIGCGPGRFVEFLSAHGLATLGVDVSAAAVAQTAARGGSVLTRSVRDHLPGQGRWGSVLLADGNVGIGGDPRWLLGRCAELLRPGGLALVEADPDDAAESAVALRLHGPGGRTSTPLAWARVGSRALLRVAGEAGFVAVEDWRVRGRVFLALRSCCSRSAASGSGCGQQRDADDGDRCRRQQGHPQGGAHGLRHAVQEAPPQDDGQRSQHRVVDHDPGAEPGADAGPLPRGH